MGAREKPGACWRPDKSAWHFRKILLFHFAKDAVKQGGTADNIRLFVLGYLIVVVTAKYPGIFCLLGEPFVRARRRSASQTKNESA
jgi:hypothetical protein